MGQLRCNLLYVTKPTNFDRFSEAMLYVGWYWLNFNESP
jgi:hypothetical protein